MNAPPSATRVLIVEDEALIAMSAEDMVEEIGFAVAATAATLSQALAAADAGGFDVAMLDINLNGELSLPVAERLRACGTPYLFTTGYGSEGPGCDRADAEILKKPYRVSDLAAALVRALKRESIAAAAPLSPSRSPIPGARGRGSERPA